MRTKLVRCQRHCSVCGITNRLEPLSIDCVYFPLPLIDKLVNVFLRLSFMRLHLLSYSGPFPAEPGCNHRVSRIFIAYSHYLVSLGSTSHAHRQYELISDKFTLEINIVKSELEVIGVFVDPMTSSRLRMLVSSFNMDGTMSCIHFHFHWRNNHSVPSSVVR